MGSPTHPAMHASPREKIIIKFLVNQFNNHHTRSKLADMVSLTHVNREVGSFYSDLVLFLQWTAAGLPQDGDIAFLKVQFVGCIVDQHIIISAIRQYNAVPVAPPGR